MVLVAGVLWGASPLGCGGAPPAPAAVPASFGAEPLVVLPSTAGTKEVAVWTSPQPPVKGVIAVQLQVTDSATGSPLDGLAIQAVPWMPSHGHGTSAKTLVQPEEAGVYQVDNVYLYMDGAWELRTTLTAADGPDTVVPVFDVP
jgi:hypothetical protein